MRCTGSAQEGVEGGAGAGVGGWGVQHLLNEPKKKKKMLLTQLSSHCVISHLGGRQSDTRFPWERRETV